MGFIKLFFIKFENNNLSILLLDKRTKDNENIFIENSTNVAQQKVGKESKNLNENKPLSKENPIEEIKKLIEDSNLSKYYKIEKWLKTGGSGYVFRAKILNINTEIHAVLKVILFDNKNQKKGKSENQKESNIKEEYIIVHSEIEIHNKLKHKNITDIYGYFLIKGGSCIAMESCKRCDLENFKKKIIKKPYFSETLSCYSTF